MKFWYRACPRCGGDLQMQRGLEETYVHCVQCGAELTALQEAFLHRRGYVPQDVHAAVQGLYEGAWRWTA